MPDVFTFRFLELSQEIFAVDALGNMDDLGHDLAATPDLLLPPIVASRKGRGREFGEDLGMVGDENVADSARLIRDCTIRAILQYDIAAASVSDVGTICVRGRGGSNPEILLYGLELVKVDSVTVKIRARWQEASSTDAIVAGVDFVLPPGFIHVACSRRWISTSEVALTYVVNGVLVGTETVSEGDIGEGVGGQLNVGCANDNSTVDYERFLPDGSIMDWLAVSDDAKSVEELRQEYRNVFVHQPAGYQILRAYQPPRRVFNPEPDSRVQRWFGAAGDGLGIALSNAETLREDFLPDRAWGPALTRWESITGLSPAPTDSIAVRRTRVLGFLSRILGYTVADIKLSLEPLFGLDSSDIDIIEYDALRTDDFGTDDISTPPSRIWLTHQGAGAVAIAAGVCNVSASASDDIRWIRAGGDPPYRVASISAATGRDADGATLITSKDVQALGTDVIYGHVWHTINKDAVIVGHRRDGITDKISAFTVLGTVQSATVDLFTVGVTDPLWLLTRYLGGTDYEVAFSTTGPLTGYNTPVAFTGPESPRWAGFGLFGLDASLVANSDADFDDVKIYEPNGTRAFSWQAYRDTGLSGTYDITAAQQQLAKQKPAHTNAAAVTNDTDGFELGPTGSGRLGIDPLYPADQIIS
jgi:hypothetical protein